MASASPPPATPRRAHLQRNRSSLSHAVVRSQVHSGKECRGIIILSRMSTPALKRHMDTPVKSASAQKKARHSARPAPYFEPLGGARDFFWPKSIMLEQVPEDEVAAPPRAEGEPEPSQEGQPGLPQFAHDGSYEGETKNGVKNGVRHGIGRYTWKDGLSFEGQYEDGVRTGYGVLWGQSQEFIQCGRYEDDQFVESCPVPLSALPKDVHVLLARFRAEYPDRQLFLLPAGTCLAAETHGEIGQQPHGEGTEIDLSKDGFGKRLANGSYEHGKLVKVHPAPGRVVERKAYFERLRDPLTYVGKQKQRSMLGDRQVQPAAIIPCEASVVKPLSNVAVPEVDQRVAAARACMMEMQQQESNLNDPARHRQSGLFTRLREWMQSKQQQPSSAPAKPICVHKAPSAVHAAVAGDENQPAALVHA